MLLEGDLQEWVGPASGVAQSRCDVFSNIGQNSLQMFNRKLKLCPRGSAQWFGGAIGRLTKPPSADGTVPLEVQV